MRLIHCVFFAAVLLPMLGLTVAFRTEKLGRKPAKSSEKQGMSSGDSRAATKRVVGYFTSWAQYRPGIGKATPDKVDPRLFTNIIYAFVDWDSNFQMTTYDWKDTDFFGLMNLWKNQNPDIKVSLAVGGWPSPSGPRAAREFSLMASTAANRKKFIDGTISFLRKYQLDGVDIDWEYPESKDTNNFVALVKEMRTAFNAEASGTKRLLLSIAVAAGSGTIPNYGWGQIKTDFDWVTVMAYDFHGGWDNNAAHHSSRTDSMAAVNNYIAAGVPASILSLGMPFYGCGNTPAGQYTGEQGILSYYEVRERLNSGWKLTNENGGPKASSGTSFIYFDNASSLGLKAADAKAKGLGGVSFWTVDFDLFQTTFTSQERFELTKAVRAAFL